MRCVVSKHLISSWERGFKIFLRLYIPPEASQRVTAYLPDLWCHSAVGSFFFVCGATLMHLNKIFPFSSGESLLGLIDELLADFCNRDLFTYCVAHKCIMWITDKAPTQNQWLHTSFSPFEAFSTALKDKPERNLFFEYLPHWALVIILKYNVYEDFHMYSKYSYLLIGVSWTPTFFPTILSVYFFLSALQKHTT